MRPMQDDLDSDFPKLALTCSNWRLWIEKAEDYLRERKHHRADTMISAAWWIRPAPVANAPAPVDPALAFRNLPATDDDERSFKIIHAQAFAYLRRKLTDALFTKTLNIEHKTVPELLRFLRGLWNDGSVLDRVRLKDEMEALRLERFDTYLEYEAAFENISTTLEFAGITAYANDEDKLYKLCKGLDDTWRLHKELVQATSMNYTDAKAYFQKVAKSNHSITGTSLIASKKRSITDRVHATQDHQKQPQFCRLFAKGACRYGDKCKYQHGNTNAGNQCDTRTGRQNGGGAVQEQRKCKCGATIKGPKFWRRCRACHQKQQDGSQQHTANTVVEESETQSDPSGQDVTELLGGYCFATSDPESVSIDPTLAGVALVTQRGGDDGNILFAMDSAATVGVVEDGVGCIDIVPFNSTVKVGGDGKPNFVQVRKRGLLPINQMVDGVQVRFNLPVFIIPGFGISIFPLSFLLKRKIKTIFDETTMTAVGRDGRVKLQAKALHYDRDSWLFYTKVRVDGGLVPLCTETVNAAAGERGTCGDDGFATAAEARGTPVPVTYAMHVSEGEDERRTLAQIGEAGPVDEVRTTLQGETGTVMAAISRDPKSLIMLYHKRLGHHNLRGVADLLGLPLPADMPHCIVCKLAKSKRSALTGGGEANFESPRPGHTFQWDHAGPFPEPDWDGNHMLSLKIDVYSGRLFGRMVKSTGTATAEWIDFVRRLNAHFGKLVVARLITDDSPYFATHELQHFNGGQGIVHTPMPPHTQELNGRVERTFGTLFSMARAAMLEACTPTRSYGLCLQMMIDTLNVMMHKRGGRLSRNEKWHNKIMPHQHKHLGIWGCAAVLHLNHGARGHVGGPGKLPKLDAPGEMCILVGYGEFSKRVLRIKLLPKIVVYESAHVTLIENVFPFKAKPETPLGDFLTEAQQQLLEAQDESAAAISPPRGRGRPPNDAGNSRSQRSRQPSAQALRNLPDADQAPDIFAEALEDAHVIEHFKPYLNDSTWLKLDSDLQDKLDGCFEEVWTTIGGAEDERNYFKLITESPHKKAWLEALAKEWRSHRDLKTMTAAIDPKDLPPGVRPIPFDLIGKVKRDGTYKCRGIVKGYHMREGIDFNDTFATVPCLTSLRFFLALAAEHDWDVWQGDVSTAFLAADMDTDLYMAVPNWFCEHPTGEETGFSIRKAHKAIPGVPQGPRLWNKTSKAIFEEGDLRQSKAESCLYFCIKRHIYLIVWVDDLFLFAPKEAAAAVAKLWKFLQGKVILGDMEPISDCLGVTVTRDRVNNKMWLSQRAAVDKIIKRAQLTEAKTAATPMLAGLKLTKKDCPSAEAAAVMTDQQRHYRSVLASIIYIMNWTRPDVAYTVSKLCRFMHNPGEEHIKALKRLLRYMAGTADYGLRYDFSNGWNGAAHKNCKETIHGFFDAAHADCVDTYKTTGAFVFFYCNCAISWHTKLLPTVTTSTNHSEYVTGAKAAKEARWLHNFAEEVHMNKIIKPIDVYSDSQGAIAMTYNPVHRSTTKHIALADHYVREQQEEGVISVSYVDTMSMIADAFTKPLAEAAFLRHRQFLVGKIGV
jgi:hypothetical protein